MQRRYFHWNDPFWSLLRLPNNLLHPLISVHQAVQKPMLLCIQLFLRKELPIQYFYKNEFAPRRDRMITIPDLDRCTELSPTDPSYYPR